MPDKPLSFIRTRHPVHNESIFDWQKWRDTYEGGDDFKTRYLQKFTDREDQTEFDMRKKLTPVPRFAGSAVDDIRNSIFQRMRDIQRTGGSKGYQEAVQGKNGGVDRQGRNMDAFLGMDVLTDLLVMGKVGVYVDSSAEAGETLADASNSRPYVYAYPVEDILNWKCADPEHPNEFQSVMLRDKCLSFDPLSSLPSGVEERFRLVWIDPEDGFVRLKFMDANGEPVDREGNPTTEEPIKLELRKIPFTLIDISRSLIKDVADYQIALLNLTSSDIWYALKANFPFYTEQRDMRATGRHLKRVATDDTGESSSGSDEDIKVGQTRGRAYPIGADRPEFIHPSPEPLKASMELQKKFEGDIRRLVNLSVATLSSRQSAESKSLDNQGLESGLSYIGLVLEAAERKIADFWAIYENRTVSKRQVPTIKYPDRYSLKTDGDRIEEADKLSELLFRIPSRAAKREISKNVVASLLSGKVPPEVLNEIEQEINSADYLTSDPKTILEAVERGLVGEKTGSIALGFKDEEHVVAREDHAARLARIQKAQSPVGDNPAARGLPDADPDPESGKREREEATNADEDGDRSQRQRGEGRNNNE